MTHQALARKWRPQTLDTVVGQPHVVRALTHMLKTQQLHPVTLFTGTRGVGKTTLGRIAAKCVNCESGISPTPCMECHACLSIASGTYTDLIEIDAASRTKVEDTRDVLEHVSYRPTHGRYKVYLIDEVHMLSGHSFNALLKTLEEPPKHVLFILATTEPEKLPETVLSRCLHFQLNSMQTQTVCEHLSDILQKEAIPFEADALNLIAEHGQGSIRDSLSILDQVLAYCQGNITAEQTSHTLGLLPQQQLYDLLSHAASENSEALAKDIQTLDKNQISWPNVLTQLTRITHQIALIQSIPSLPSSSEAQRLASQISPTLIQLFYQILIRGQSELNLAPNPRIGGHMTLLRLMHYRPVSPSPLTLSVESFEKNSPTYALPNPKKDNVSTDSKPPPETLQKKHSNNESDWHAWIQSLNIKGWLGQLLLNSERSTAQGNHWTIQFNQSQFITKQQEKRIQDVLEKGSNSSLVLSFSYKQTDHPSTLKQAPTSTRQPNIEQEPGFKKIIQTFDLQTEDQN